MLEVSLSIGITGRHINVHVLAADSWILKESAMGVVELRTPNRKVLGSTFTPCCVLVDI